VATQPGSPGPPTEAAAGRPPSQATSVVRLASLFAAPMLVVVGAILARRILASEIHALAVTVQDDSFYYLVPAFLLKKFGFFTFDGRTLTYGFQPGYELLLAVLALPFRRIEEFFRAALLLQTALHLATALGIARLVARDAQGRSPESGVLAAGISVWLFLSNPMLLLSATTCKENALASLLLVALIAVVDRADRLAANGRRLSLPLEVAIGSFAGSLLLVRFHPNSLVLVAILGALFWRRHGFRPAAVVAAALPLGLWSSYAVSTFGALMPIAGRLKTLGALPGSTAASESELVRVVRYLWQIVRFVAGFRSDFHLPQPDAYATGWAAWVELGLAWLRVTLVVLPVLVLLIAGAARARRHERRAESGAGSLLPTTLLLLVGSAVGSAIAVVALRRQGSEIYYFTWYLFDAPVLLPLVGGLLTSRSLALIGPSAPERIRGRAPARGPRRTASLAMGSILAAGLTLLPLARFQPFPDFRASSRRWSDTMVLAAMWLQDRRPPGSEMRIGAFDAGSLGFFFPGQVVNLDGLANDEAAAWLLSGKPINDYIRTLDIDYLMNARLPGVTDDPRLGLRELHRFRLGESGYVIWRVSPASRPVSP